MSQDIQKEALSQFNSEIGNVSEDMDGSNTPKTTNAKRAIFSVANVENFVSDSNPTGFVPAINEICADENGNIYIWAQTETGEKILISASKALQDEFTELKKLGIISNASAFRLNGKIYNFYFDNDKKILILNTELDLYEQYAYYSVRKLERDPVTGDYVYITGIKNTDTGVVSTNLVEIISDGERNRPKPGFMINSCLSGDRYVVDFYDSKRSIIGSEIYYARETHALDFSLAPDMSISDLVVATDRPYKHADENGCFLYQNEDPNNLIIRVGLKYVDGNTRDITEESKTTGRLIFEGKESIDTSNITDSVDNAQEIKVVYYKNMDNSPELPIEDPNDLTVIQADPNVMSLNKILKVFIVEDIYDPIIDIVLHGYKETRAVEGGASAVTDIYTVKVFAKYESGVMRDITPVMDNTRFISLAGFVYNTLTRCLETSKILSNFAVEIRVPQGRSQHLFQKQFSCEFTEYNKRLGISKSTGGFDTKDGSKTTLFNPTQQKMRLSENDTLATLKETYSYKYNLENKDYIIPNYVIVRDGLNLDVIYSGENMVDSYTPLDNENGVINYYVPDNNLIFEDKPLIIEFYKITVDPDTGARTSIFLTNVQRTYAKATSVSLG